MKQCYGIFLGCMLIAVLVGCTKQSEVVTLQQRVQMQDQQLRQLQPVQADSYAQLQAMRAELDTIKGQMDDLNNAGGARALVDKVHRHDAALRQVGTSLALDLRLDAPAPVGMMGGGMEDTGEPDPYGGAGMMSQQEARAASGTTVITSQHAPTPPAAPKDIATALFDAGVADFNNRKYQEAERSFVDFTKNYPNHRQVPNAWYYIGECSFQRNQFADAALAYDKVITKYGSSPRAAAAYLKQGIAFSKLGQTAAAKARMQELIKKYPTSAEAARAKSFLQTNQ